MDKLTQVFQYEDKPVRTVLVGGEPWFVAKDVCDILEIANSRDAVGRLDEDEKGVVSTDTPGGRQEMAAVNEPGLYNLVMGSRKPEAKMFQRWVRHEVLPAIRKTGTYSRLIPQTLSEALRLAADQAEQIEKQTLELAAAKPKVQFFDAVANSKDAIPIGRASKVLAVKGYGPINLFKFLREQKILMADNIPYQEYIDRGYFRTVEQKWTTPKGETRISIKTLVYQKGLNFIRRKLEREVS